MSHGPLHLLDNVERNNYERAKYTESKFAYLNRSARPEAGRVRALLEDWFSCYPTSHQPDLRGRFRSDNDAHHLGAFFELFLHELLTRLPCRVEVHPSIGLKGERRPDFLATPVDGNPFYTEGVLATEESVEAAGARARTEVVYDVLNRVESPNFFLAVNVRGAPKTPPPAKQIKAFVTQQLAALDPEHIAEAYKLGGLDALPRWPFSHEGWMVEFSPIPKKPDARNKPGVRPLGLFMYGVKMLNTKTALRDTIMKKAGRYGKLEWPYVVSVNAVGEYGVDRIDIMDALFGTEGMEMTYGESGPTEPRMTRAPDGVWVDESGPRYTRVSAVLMALPVLPWNVPRAKTCLYHNPWAEKPYQGGLTRMPQAIPVDGHMQWKDGEPLAAIFNLSTDWPEA